MATLRIDNLSKQFSNKTWGVRDVSLDVRDKEFVVLLGPSGCGKTTTLRAVAGLEEPTAGTIRIDNNDVTFLPPRKRQISMVFQNYAVWPHMSVYENIAFALQLRGQAEKDIAAAVLEVARLTKIDGLLQRFPAQLSGGQQQRVSLARALAVKPKLFLMDEPFSNLDAALRVQMRTETKAIHSEAASTTVFVTHDQAEAMSMADRIIIMNEGRIVQEGTPDDVYHRSASTFVAGFVGIPPMNFFSMQVSREGDQLILVGPHFTMPLPRDFDPRGREWITLGVRPEDICVTDADHALFSRDLLVVEPQGSHQVLSLRLEDNVVKVIAPPQPKVRANDKVHLAFNRGKLHYFDSKTEKRLQT